VNVVTGVSVLGLKLENRRVAGIRTTASQFEARVFVAADGLQSRLRRQAGLDARDPSDRYGVSAHARLPSPPARTIDVHFQRNREVYITPLDGSSANIALLLRKGEMAGVEGDLVRWFQRQLQAIPALEGYELEDVPLVAGPFGRSVKRAWRGNLVFTGDAAGFLDGISGDGISAGLLGARACAEAIDSYLSSGDFDAFRAYDRARRDIVRNSNFLARVSLTLGRNERIAAIAVANLSRRPETFAKLIAINSRAAGFSSLRPRDVLVLAAGI
jgi:flavin-dependent dehydrogenase